MRWLLFMVAAMAGGCSFTTTFDACWGKCSEQNDYCASRAALAPTSAGVDRLSLRCERRLESCRDVCRDRFPTPQGEKP